MTPKWIEEALSDWWHSQSMSDLSQRLSEAHAEYLATLDTSKVAEEIEKATLGYGVLFDREEFNLRISTAIAPLLERVSAIQREQNEVESILGKALGLVADGEVCVGEHVPVSLAMEAAKRVAELEGLLRKVNGRIRHFTGCPATHRPIGRCDCGHAGIANDIDAALKKEVDGGTGK